MSWNVWRAHRPVRAAGSSPPTPWRWWSEGSGWRCPGPPARRHLMRTATDGRWSRGCAVMALLDSRLRPRDIVTREALVNAAVVVGANNWGARPMRGCTCRRWRTRRHQLHHGRRGGDHAAHAYIADLKLGGNYVAFDVHKIGGIPVVLKALLDGGL